MCVLTLMLLLTFYFFVGYAPVLFPGITEGIQYGDGNLTVAQEWVSKTARGILRAADIIKT